MSSYAEASAAVGGTEPQPHGVCAAFGCCLPGSMSSSTQGTQTWYCRLHFGAPRGEWDDISARAQNRKALFTAAYWLLNRPHGHNADRKIGDRIRALGRNDLLEARNKAGGCTCYALGAHMLQVLGKECRAPQQDMGTPKSPTQGPTWIDQSQPEEANA